MALTDPKGVVVEMLSKNNRIWAAASSCYCLPHCAETLVTFGDQGKAGFFRT